MSSLSRKAYEKRVSDELRARLALKYDALESRKGAPTPEAIDAAAKAERELYATGYTITASRYAVGGDEWFDLCGGPITFEDAARVAREYRLNARLAGWAITVFQGVRSSGFTLREVMCLSELL